MNQTVAGTGASPAARPALTPVKGLLALLAVVVMVALFIWLSHALGIVEVWAGFLFVLYWAALEHVQMEKLVPSIVGSLAGFGLACSMHVLPEMLGTAGWAIFLGGILVAVYFHLMGWLTTVVNLAFMLFLTVGTIPAVQQHADLPNAYASLVYGIVFMVVLVVGGKWAVAQRGKRAQ